METIKIEVTKEFCGYEKGSKMEVPHKNGTDLIRDGYAKLIGRTEKIEKKKKRVSEKVETKDAPEKKIAKKGLGARIMTKVNSIK